MILRSYSDKSLLVASLNGYVDTHSNDVARQVETPLKSTTFVVRHDFNVALEVTLYSDCKIRGCCKTCIFSLTICEVLRHAAPFFCSNRPIYHNTLILRFWLGLVALCKSLTMT